MTIRVDDLSITIAALEKLSKNNLMSLFIRRNENLDNTMTEIAKLELCLIHSNTSKCAILRK